MNDGALTPREVADALGVTVRTVQRWIASRRLPARRVGGRLRVERSALARVSGMSAGTPTAGAMTAGPTVGLLPAIQLRRLLIANRGEIVERVARTARRLGIEAVGIHAADDRPPTGVDRSLRVAGYLDVTGIVEAAQRAAADALHPGYGFLAESPELAQAAVDAGLRWVGPPPSAIAAMGDKAEARRRAAAAGVPVLPGYDGLDQDDERLIIEAARIGPPLLVKPAAGGGGKGLRVVRALEELPAAIAAARREAQRAFGNERLILERLLTGPRHIEVQVLFDEHGTAVHLGERDCSAQRRNQKILEESPAPSVTSDLRERLGAAALAVAGAIGYVNAGTVEFLVANDGAFWFLEMNTRLQVEHPVTEAVTGRDLVADQLRIAAGQPLGIAQADVRRRGHAIEARLYAEEPEAGFLPATGRVLRLRWPAGIRVDAGVAEGDEVTDRYDPLLAKLIAHGPSRRAALDRLRAALDVTSVLGVRTNLRFLRWLLAHPAVRDAEVRTDTVADLLQPDPPIPDEAAWRRAAVAASGGGLLPDGLWGGGWRPGAPAIIRLRTGELERRVELDDALPTATPLAVADSERGVVHVEVEGQSVEFGLAPAPTVDEAVRHAAVHGDAHATLVAPMPGRVVAVRARAGSPVAAHAPVIMLEAMKMEHAVVSPLAGTVTRLAVREGQQVQRGELLAEVSA